MLDIVAQGVAALILVLGVPSRMKYYWQGSKVQRRKSAHDVSRKFYLVSEVVYILQVIHNLINGDWVDVVFWGFGTFTVGYCIWACYVHWHEQMGFWKWVLDSFRNPEEGGWWR